VHANRLRRTLEKLSSERQRSWRPLLKLHEATMLRAALTIAMALAGGSMQSRAEDGAAGWLRYAPLVGTAAATGCSRFPAEVAVAATGVGPRSADAAIVRNAGQELSRGLTSMCGHAVRINEAVPDGDALVVGTVGGIEETIAGWHPAQTPGRDGYLLSELSSGGHHYVVIAGGDARGTLYGAFALLAQIGQGRAITTGIVQTPVNAIRWVNEWNNLDGSIERGYAGRSVFFDGGHVRGDLSRAGEYARLLSSVGINGCTINNVNASPQVLSPAMIAEVARIADAFRPWGVRMSMSIDFSSPQAIGGLATFDPLDPAVAAWWAKTVDSIYAQIPDFAGFVVKADSEGKPGPSQYGRSPAEAANVLARALKPHGGLVLYRGFVYNHHADWTDMKADRAKAGSDNFSKLDGTFDDNVVIQIKNGPIDFQVREPASPLFAALRKTNQAIEFQVTQEYLGQQRHLVYLVPMWKTTLDTDMRAEGRSTPVKEIVAGKSFHRPLGGFVGVANVGLDADWVKHPLAMANLYGYGRLASNPDLTSEEIADEWTRLTFGNEAAVDQTIDGVLLRSWHLYEDYTGPLGLGTLTDIVGAHYGPGIESAERNGWGQWLRADHDGIGMDRTVATGTGYIGQYPPELAAKYELLASCPDELLLFMHHVPYTYVLHSGKTVVQHVYDSHYEGAAGAAQLYVDWSALKGHVDDERFAQVQGLLQYQAGHAIVWRDAVTNWFLRMSGVPDGKGRVGDYPDRVEAESMQLRGYTAADVTPWETASGGKAVVCKETECAATTSFAGAAGSYRVAVEYFDFHDGASAYSLEVNGKEVAEWTANDTLPTNIMNGSTSTRYLVAEAVSLKPGDAIEVVARPDGKEPAPLDYISIVPVDKASVATGAMIQK
jgi:alpha-glucuronidase